MRLVNTQYQSTDLEIQSVIVLLLTEPKNQLAPVNLTLAALVERFESEGDIRLEQLMRRLIGVVHSQLQMPRLKKFGPWINISNKYIIEMLKDLLRIRYGKLDRNHIFRYECELMNNYHILSGPSDE